MNTFIPQSIQTMSELKDLAAVPYMVLAPRNGKPIIEVVQDSMVGSFRLTQDWVRIHDKTMANLQMVNSYFKGKLPESKEDNHSFTGREAFTQILPPGLFIETKNNGGKKVIIRNSEHVAGAIDKSVYHSISRGIIPVVYHDYGPFEVRRFLDNMQRLICRWLMSSGFSVGISDLVVDGKTSDRLKEIIHESKTKAYSKIQEVRQGKFENNSIFSNEDQFEREMKNILNESNKKVEGLALKQIQEETNRMINMVKSGSKGKDQNVAQMIACVGQQNVDGKRVAYGFTDRTLPHYNKFDDGPEARGFVENSFISGLTPQEVFFHAMGGREGLIDTAVRSVTADTPVFVMDNGIPKYVNIGGWIDAYLDKYADEVKHYDERQLELLYIDTKNENKVFIPTMDNDGKVLWSELVAVTRHDPGDDLYEITTMGGRNVIVTESKSLLVWDDNRQQFWEKPTSEVKLGDYVPVTANLTKAPVTMTYVDMTTYFPKTEYLYGSDYNQAVRMMKEAQQDRMHIPRGWWQQHNGTTFTLPYPSKARLQRASVRSNNENIHDNCVYPYHASRDTARIPAQFELNYENGVFIGLYLADGNTDTPCGSIQITKRNPKVQDFVRTWFSKFNISHRTVSVEKTRGKVTGVSEGVVGNSSLLARFLDAFVGVGAGHKHVPDVAFVAPIEFTKGLLSGYLSGDGSIVRGGIECSSISKRLIEGIAMLCTQMGAFGKMSIKTNKSNEHLGSDKISTSYCLAIRAQWAQKLADTIDLVHDTKNTQLKNMSFTTSHRNYKEHNDVVLDEIVSIKKVDTSKYPKVYDVTVPETLNFGLGNGLMVYDTSETGYIQRRLVKAMEDCKIYYDHTVRNATGAIVQFLYGEDGMDGSRLENQFISSVGMNFVEADATYRLRPEDKIEIHMTEAAYQEMQKEENVYNALEKHFYQLMDDKEFLIQKVFHGEQTEKLTFPIPFDRIMKNAIERTRELGLDGVPSDLTPGYVLKTIEELQQSLKMMSATQGTRFLHILLRHTLSPKPLIMKHHMSRPVFDWVVDEIKRYYLCAIAHPGEMVGIVAAQTIGENSTQLVLDSFHSSGTVAAVKATSGVPRFKELLSVSKNIKTPILTIHLKEDIGTVVNAQEDSDGNINDPLVHEAKMRSMKVMHSLRITRMVDVLDSTEIYWDPSNNASGASSSIEEDDKMLEVYRVFGDVRGCRATSSSPWVLRMKLNKEKMYNLGLTMMDVYLRVFNAYNNVIECMFSDDNADELIFRVRMTEQGMKDIEQEDAVAALKAIEHNLIYNVLLKGVRGIKKVSMHIKTRSAYDPETTAFQKVTEWILDTDGSNLQEILANPNVNAYRTYSNDIWEIYSTLGIEAARNALCNEILDVIGDGANFRHLSLLLDTMTNRGQLMSIDRHGINRGDVGPLAKSSFEETTDMLINASVFSECDKINGVSANIMLGQLPPCGTGDSEVVLDEDAYIRLLTEKRGSNPLKKHPVDDKELPTCQMDAGPVDTVCGYEEIAFQYNLPEKSKKAIQPPKMSYV